MQTLFGAQIKSVLLFVYALATAALAIVSGLTMIIGQEVAFAIGDRELVPGTAKGHGDEVSDVASGR